jgi:hypothetical protein
MRVTRGQAEFHVEDGRVTLDFAAGAKLYLDVPDHPPLSENEPHATLRIVSDAGADGVTELDLDGDAVAALQAALVDAPTGECDE